MMDYKPETSRIEITEESAYYLREISRWARFLSVIGFIMIGVMAIGVFVLSALVLCMNENAQVSGLYPYRPGVVNWPYLIIYFGMLAACFFPVYYLFKFSSRIKAGLDNNDSIMISESFRFLKNHYLMIGTLTIIGVIFLMALFAHILYDIISCFS